MELNDTSTSENKHGEEAVIINSKTAEIKIEDDAYVNTSLVVDNNVLDRRESHVYDHLHRSHDTASHCKGGCITRFKHYKDCIMLILIGVLFIAVTLLAIFIGLPEKSDQSFPKVDGGWSTWGSWSECSASCGTGMASRNRSCSNPKPSNGGDHCLGESTEYRVCNTFACLDQYSPKVDGGWSTWGSWSECSALCGIGMASRNRLCSNPKPSNGADHCFGDSTEYQLCNKVPCPVGKNCKDLMDKGDTTTGFKIFVPDGINPIRVLCIMDEDGGGWTVIQKRETATDFNKNWQHYRTGFGDDTNFWLGLENIYRLTAQGSYELRIDIARNNNQRAAAKYKTFSLGNEAMLYKLTLGNYSFDPAFNDPGESFLYHNGMKFSTYDNDNDEWSGNCAFHKGGYWYKACAWNNLNGEYGSTADRQGINWYSWTGYEESLKYTRMMIRPN